MNKNVIVPIVAGLAALLTACGASAAKTESEQQTVSLLSSSVGQEKKAEYHKITQEKAYERMNNEEEFVLLDVRTQEEFEVEHIEGAVLIPDYELADRAEEELPDKDQVIFIYCRSGHRSANAAAELVAKGYTNVYDFGGIMSWPYETV